MNVLNSILQSVGLQTKFIRFNSFDSEIDSGQRKSTGKHANVVIFPRLNQAHLTKATTERRNGFRIPITKLLAISIKITG